jgi:uncharacterized membrane protein YwzB
MQKSFAQQGTKTNSVMRNTQPATAAQHAYYSRHGHKIQKYANARTVIKWCWFALAAIGFQAIISTMLSQVPYILPISVVLATLLSFFLHDLLEASSITAVFGLYDDKDGDGDNKDKADLSIIFPIMLGLGLLAADYWGSKTFLEKRIAPPTLADRTAITSTHSAETDRETTRYQQAKRDIQTSFDRQRNAARAYAQAKIRGWNARPVISDNDRAFVRRGIADAQAEEAKTQRRISEQEAKEMATAKQEYDQGIARLQGQHDDNIARADRSDESEFQRLAEEKGMARKNSWLLSLFFLICYAFCVANQIGIMARCGIFPIREFSELDANGGFWHKLWEYVILDTWKRQSHRLLVHIHNNLNRDARHLVDFDGTLILHNTQPLPYTPPLVSMPPSPQPKRVEHRGCKISIFEEDGVFHFVLKNMEGSVLLLSKTRRPEGYPTSLDAEAAATRMADAHSVGALKEAAREIGILSGELAQQPAKRQPTPSPTQVIFETNSRDTVLTTVSQPQPENNGTVTQLNGSEFLGWLLTQLRRDAANLNNRNGLPETVLSRIIRIIDNAQKRVGQPDFNASESDRRKAEMYLTSTLMPIVRAAGLSDQGKIDKLADALMGVAPK